MENRIALVTGGSGGIGGAICKRLANAGHHVVVHTNTRIKRAEEIVGEIKSSGGSADAVQFDVTNEIATRKELEILLEKGPVQVLVNNAGIHDDAIMAGMSQKQWHRVIDVSLHGFFNVTQPLLLPMMQMRWGRIINISSIAGVRGNRGQTNYAAAKAGLIGASKSLAIEMASRGITINVVSPGIIENDMTKDVFDDGRIKECVPMNRAGKNEEVAAVVGFLASEDASYVSGQVIGVDGAML